MYENQEINIGKILTRLTTIILLIIICLLAKHLLVGDYVSLSTAPNLAAEVSSSLASSKSTVIPTPNKDFKLVRSLYFNNKKWAVVVIMGESSHSDKASLVLEKINGVYTVVLGPGTEFSPDVIQEMPSNVSTYLINEKLIT